MKRKALVTAMALLLGSGALTACGGGGGGENQTGNQASAGAPAAANSDTLTVGLSADPPKLDPKLSTALVDRQVMINIYDTLFTIGPNNEIEPDLVEKYEVSQDGKTYTFHLRHGVKFQDGTPFNAAAVKFNIQRDQEKDSLQRSYLTPIVGIDTPDDYTVVLHLNKPYSPLLAILTDRPGMMVSPTAVQKEGDDFVNHPVGTGPYAFKERVKGDHVTLVKNPNYWQSGQPHFNTVTYKIFTDQNVEVANLQSGQVQMIDTIPAQQVATLSQNPNFTVINQPGFGFQGLYLNVKKAPFDNKYLREAVELGIDRKALVDTVFKGAASPGYTPFSQASSAYNQAQDTPPQPDPAKIKDLLAKGGKPNGFSFELQTAATPVTVQAAQVIQGMLSQYGIQVQIKQMEFGTVLDNATKHNFQASALGWSGRLDPDQNIYSWFHTDGSQNDEQYSNPTVDQLLDQARAQLDPQERAKTYSQVMDIIHDEAPYVFLYHQNNLIAYSKHLTGFEYRADGLLRLATVSAQ